MGVGAREGVDRWKTNRAVDAAGDEAAKWGNGAQADKRGVCECLCVCGRWNE